MPPKKSTKKTPQQAKLSQSLVLNRYILNLFGCTQLEALSEHLKDAALEHYDENNVSLFHHELVNRLFHNENFTSIQLLEYDQNIFRHTQQISTRRIEPIRWKYFQYLALLFTEVYLDKYFSDKLGLMAELNAYLENEFNNDAATFHEITPFTENDLNKIAFWNATGSGKTLLTHINILQHQHYVAKYNAGKVNRVILLTPNEGLSAQHLQELQLSDMEAELFNKSAGSLFRGKAIEIIDINKLGEKDGDKTVAVGSFEGSNLVLVDEGHKGSGGEVWKGYRDALCATGFSFEYSATFGQSIGAAAGAKKNALINEYAKATIFDYSYRYFYNDGYGKDYRIMNIKDTWNDEMVNMYLTACLLSFYEQTLIFESDSAIKGQFLIEKPLSVFVGSSVSAVRTENKREVSDVVTILQFFEQFIGKPEDSQQNIMRLLTSTDGLVDKNNRSIFGSSFKFIRKSHPDNEAIYSAMLSKLFNSDLAGARLHLDNLKGQTGEIGLRIGNSDYFGVINVGDDAKLLKLCEEQGILTEDKDFTDRSLFRGINHRDSKINVLIGSKKFTEGWSSWRVSTMGLLNVGQGEGSQIIQLFGRGVRLKGYKFCLKRSSALDYSLKDRKNPEALSTLETLNIFGIRADYMEQFKKYLEEEGLPTNDSDFEEITIPMLPMVNLSDARLKYIRVKEGLDFKKAETVKLTDGIGRAIISLDWYPKVQILKSGKQTTQLLTTPDEGKLLSHNLACVDWNKVYFDLQRFKNEKSWYNLQLDIETIKKVAYNVNWYRLYIPKPDLEPTNFAKNTTIWQEIITSLLRLYVDKVYNTRKAAWMAANVEVAYLDKNNPNFEEEYNLLVHKDLDRVLTNLQSLKLTIENNLFVKDIAIDGNDFNALFFEPHLYQPLLYINKDRYKDEETDAPLIEIRPVALNKGEKQLIVDLKAFHTNNTAFFADKELYLLRNQSRKGIGFFEANNFYPDFILWLKVGAKQYVTFVDPKGIRQIAGMTDPKIELHKIIRTDIEPRLAGADVVLNSFIISNTSHSEIRHWAGAATLNECNKQHLFFQGEQREVYVKLMLEKIVGV
jgi:hypothetical protein